MCWWAPREASHCALPARHSHPRDSCSCRRRSLQPETAREGKRKRASCTVVAGGSGAASPHRLPGLCATPRAPAAPRKAAPHPHTLTRVDDGGRGVAGVRPAREVGRIRAVECELGRQLAVDVVVDGVPHERREDDADNYEGLHTVAAAGGGGSLLCRRADVELAVDGAASRRLRDAPGTRSRRRCTRSMTGC